jgi:hypothetical protein
MREALHKGSEGAGAKDLIKTLVQVREQQGEGEGEGQVRKKGGGGIGEGLGICYLGDSYGLPSL